MSYFIHRITRRKYLTVESVEKTQLARCLNTFDLTALGVGSTLGAGIYVVAGQVAKINSGPSVFLSFLIAAVASILAGLCYAEFGARVPKTGSAYVYSYVTVGELMAFVIGWNLILEYVIGTSSVARAWSLYFDSLIDNKIQNAFREHMPMHITGLSPYPDFFSFGITLLLTVVLAVGVKESSQFNNLFTGVNLMVVTYIIICGAFKADSSNWSIDPEKVTGNVTATDVGSGGFAPFGISGTLSGAATCFYAFVGFDAIATTGEEVKNPQKAIPISIIISLLVCCFAYSGISIVITLMCPYYLMDTNAPLPAVFERVGWDIAKYIIAIGAICGLSTSLLGAMFPLPRVIYAIASDGLIFRGLATVSERFKTPLIATILSGIFAGLMAMMFDLTELVEMMSIGTLLAYTLVAVSVLLLRYKVESIGGQSNQDVLDENGSADGASDSDTQYNERLKTSETLRQHTDDSQNTITLSLLFNFRNKFPSRVTEKLATFLTVIFCFLSVLFGIFLRLTENQLGEGKAWVIALTVIFVLIMVTIVAAIGCQPQNQTKITFKVPWVPVLPAISIFVNTFLMIRLPTPTWYRFAIWMALGFLMYFTYGIRHSSLNSFTDTISLHSFKPLPITDVDELFDDSEAELELILLVIQPLPHMLSLMEDCSFMVYFGYGIFHSNEEEVRRKDKGNIAEISVDDSTVDTYRDVSTINETSPLIK